MIDITANKSNMMLTSQSQQILLAVSVFLVNLPSITDNEYLKMLSLKAYSDTLKKYLSGILDYAKWM